MSNSATHTRLVKECLLALGSRPDCKVWRQARVKARAAGTQRRIETGVGGMADISGILQGGRRLEIECKTGEATLEPDQRTWRDMIVLHGGAHVVAYSVEEAVAGVEAALRGDA